MDVFTAICSTFWVRYFIDAEFNGFGGDLISLAAIPESDDAPPFYEAVDCPQPVEWVQANVLPIMQTNPRSFAEVAHLWSTYLASDAEPLLVADWPEDIAHAARLLTNGSIARSIGSRVRFELLATSDFHSEMRSQLPHNAYYDALALRKRVLEREAIG